MTSHRYINNQMLVFVWQHKLYDAHHLYTSCGKSIEVISTGYRGSDGPEFTDAELSIDGKIYKGSVSFHVNASDWYYQKRNQDPKYDNVILNISDNCDRIIRKLNDFVLMSATLFFPERIMNNMRIIAGSGSMIPCVRFVRNTMEEIELRNGLTRLLIERLERKYNDILKIYNSVSGSWHETFHIFLFRTMGLGSNKNIYTSLARNIPYSVLCRERGDIKKIEAMIFGVAGLLDEKVYDEYKSELRSVFYKLAEKHDLKILEYCQWTEKGVRPYNFAPKRLAQISRLIESGNTAFDNIIASEKLDDIRKLFDMELSHYWKRSFSFGKRSPMTRKGIGDMTVDILIINLVAPIIFAYGRETGNSELEERAIEFLYETAGEVNRYTKPWTQQGMKIDNAFFSQAVIQLSTEYCAYRRCTECFIGIKAIKTI